jgi:hypothetical protein
LCHLPKNTNLTFQVLLILSKYGNIRPEIGRPLKMENVKRPNSFLSHEFTVHPRDCDEYQHTSWKNYGNFCYETCCVFVRRSLYKNVNRESGSTNTCWRSNLAYGIFISGHDIILVIREEDFPI